MSPAARDGGSYNVVDIACAERISLLHRVALLSLSGITTCSLI